MANIKISEMAESDVLVGDEILPIVQDGITKKATIDNIVTKVDSYTKSQTDTLLSAKVDKVTGKSLSTNDLTNDLLTLLNTKKVKNVTTDAVNDRLVITYTDDTTSNLNLNDVITDIYVSGASLDATTNVLNLINANGGSNVTVNLSDFVNSSELTSALANKEDLSNKKTDIETNKASDTFFPSIKAVYDWAKGLFVSKVTSTDNAVVRFDGTSGQVQNSGVVIDDSGNLSITGGISTNNIKTYGTRTRFGGGVDDGVNTLQVHGITKSENGFKHTEILKITSGDLNSYKTEGLFFGTYPAVLNQPAPDHAYVEVIVYAPSSYVMQRWTRLFTGESYVRVLNGGVWNSWLKLNN